MKPESQEENLKMLFHEQRQAEARRAPPFERAWEVALARVGAARAKRRRFLSIAAATAILTIAGVGAAWLARFHWQPRRAIDSARLGPSPEDWPAPEIPWDSGVLIRPKLSPNRCSDRAMTQCC